MSVGQRIINEREKKDWSQRELARRVGLNPSVMNRIESGERPIKDHELAKIADVLDVSTDFLLGRTNTSDIDDLNNPEFIAFADDPELEQWYKELPKNPEDRLRRLKKIWDAIKDDE
ncbi:helix-turn-helix transcriptional regulator [Pseudobacillus sp. FSL P4-0506]|uniref:helix-turn-helix domain-containing protein n=1 Tax=Pseudobacillus sp. FSL P4-0506 TaxID=2921576 RepID=UPI0030FAB276